jgi:cardiolipin synthase
MITNLPNLLTLSRILVVPAIVGLLYLPGEFWRWVACALYILACVTDYFDGHFARTMRQTSALGRFLDPIADKLLVASVIVIMVATGQIAGPTVLAGLIILCREILVSGLREYLAELKVGVPVTTIAKWKTTLQMVALGVLIVGDAGPGWLPVRTIGELLLWIAAVLTLVTGYDYLRTGLRHMQPGRS